MVVQDGRSAPTVWIEGLAAAGYAVVEAQDERDAVWLLTYLLPHVLLLDAQALSAAFRQFWESLAQSPVLRRTPTLIISDEAAERLAEVFEGRLDVVGGLPSSIEFPVLLARVADAAARHRLRASVDGATIPSPTDRRGPLPTAFSTPQGRAAPREAGRGRVELPRSGSSLGRSEGT